jgi:flagellar hook-associated protein 3 FlgL
MRIAGTSYTDSLVNQLNTLSARQYRLQNQAATGQSIYAPEDDPVGMALTLNLQTQAGNVDQYAQNIGNLQSRASAVYNVLDQLNTLSSRISEIVTAAGDPTKSATDLQSYATEVTQRIEQAVQLLNTKQGDLYLFGGTASGQPPFTLTKDADGNVTGVTYQGNTSVAESEIAENTTLAVDIPGENNSGSGPRGLVTDNRYGADLFTHLISLQNHLLAGDANAVATTDQPALKNDEDNIIFQVATNGAVQARLETQATIAANRKSYLQKAVSDTAGADLTQTLVQLNETQNAYQAAIQSTSNLLQLQQYLLSTLS